MHRSEHDPDLHAIALEAMARSLVDQWAKETKRAGEAGMCLSDDDRRRHEEDRAADRAEFKRAFA